MTVVAANLVYLAGLRTVLDPMISMDPFYIQMARRPLSSLLSEVPAWGPLYAVWLKPFVAALGDPLAVYVANLYALSFGVSVMLYLYLLAVSRRTEVAVVAALFFVVSDFNVPLSSKVSGFALLVVLAGLTFSEAAPAGAARMTVAAVGILLASYVRPEFYPAALGIFVAATWLACGEVRKSGPQALLWPTTGLVFILVSALWSGTPLGGAAHDGGRLFIALREHFAWNWSRWHNEPPDFLDIWGRVFGGAPTVLQAVLRSPAAIFRHLGDNLLGTVRFMVATAFAHYPLLAPATSPALVTAENLSLSTAVIGSLVVAAKRPSTRRQLLERYGHALLVYAALAMCSVVAAVAIFPLPYYLLMPAVLLMLAGTLAATLIIPAPPAWSLRTQLLAALLCLAAMPKPYVLPSAYVVEGSPFKASITATRPITDTIELVRSLHLREPVQVLTFADGVGEMLGPGFREVKIWQKGAQPLAAFIKENNVGMIISLGPGQESVMVNDREWNRMRNDLPAAGFTRFIVPNHEAVGVYVRTDLVQKGGE